MIYNQVEFDLRCEWGVNGINQLVDISDVVIIVDILSFTTCVEIAVNNQAVIFPYRYKDNSAVDYARSLKAELASFNRDAQKYCLSPTSLIDIPSGTKLVLPSPNGATLSLLTGNIPTIAGCLRNCQAIARFAETIGDKIAVVPCGEKWEDRSLRPAIEDLLGAGAILSYLTGKKSPEAEAAVAVFERFQHNLLGAIAQCSSGKELIARGFSEDIELATSFNISTCIPMLTSAIAPTSEDKAYTKVAL
jgi:2-phosphosulfolactate phosphatase